MFTMLIISSRKACLIFSFNDKDDHNKHVNYIFMLNLLTRISWIPCFHLVHRRKQIWQTILNSKTVVLVPFKSRSKQNIFYPNLVLVLILSSQRQNLRISWHIFQSTWYSLGLWKLFFKHVIKSSGGGFKACALTSWNRRL